MFTATDKPAAYPTAAAFTRAAACGIGGQRQPRKPAAWHASRNAGFKGRALRAALIASGATERRVKAKLAAAAAALATGAPVAWPRGF